MLEPINLTLIPAYKNDSWIFVVAVNADKLLWFWVGLWGGRAFSKSHRASLLKQENSNIKILRVKLESIHKAAGWIQLACPVQSQKAPSSVVGALFFLSAHPMPSFSSPPPFFFFGQVLKLNSFSVFYHLPPRIKCEWIVALGYLFPWIQLHLILCCSLHSPAASQMLFTL